MVYIITIKIYAKYDIPLLFLIKKEVSWIKIGFT